MKHKTSQNLLLAGLLATFITPAFAQDERDVMRLSNLQPLGTARSIGIGGALGSVGGDFSSLSVNPAGIGIYRRSEFTMSPSLSFSNTSSGYSGNGADESGSHFSFSNLGLVTTVTSNGRHTRSVGGWSSVSFGIGLTRLADFTRDYSYSGRNTTSSGSYVFEADANNPNTGLTNNEFPTTMGDLGYDAGLLDTFKSGYISVVNATDTTPVNQSTVIRERGGISELTFSVGGAYKDKLLLGATLGIPIVRYLRTKTFEETDESGNNNNDFAYFQYSDDLKITGAGVNLKLGLIYKASDNFRLGAAIHTPTYYSLTDVQNRSLTASTEYFLGKLTAFAAENQYDYNIMSPWRGVLSATGLFGPYGFLTVDYEYVGYSDARITLGNGPGDKAQQQYVNDLIKKSFQDASNVRAGLELRFDNISLRGGFGYYGNPYKSGSISNPAGYNNPNGERISISAGIGFRFENAFLDLGFVHYQYETSEQPYQLPNAAPYLGIIVPTAQLSTITNTAVATLGFKF